MAATRSNETIFAKTKNRWLVAYRGMLQTVLLFKNISQFLIYQIQNHLLILFSIYYSLLV